MASIRKLKKEIDLKIFEIISDCFIFRELHPDHKNDNVIQVINGAVNLRNNLMHRISHPVAPAGTKDLRQHYQDVTRDLDDGVDKLCEMLSSLSKKKKK